MWIIAGISSLIIKNNPIVGKFYVVNKNVKADSLQQWKDRVQQDGKKKIGTLQNIHGSLYVYWILKGALNACLYLL
jgi:hypothetical protein